MKNSILMLSTIFMIGCNNQSTNVETEEVKTSYDIEYPLLVEEGGLYYNGTELFSGSAGQKNSSDELVLYTEFKNGYLTHRKQWTDFGGKMELTHEMEYKDGKQYNGWNTLVKDNEHITITTFYFVYKNGKERDDESWRINYDSGGYGSKGGSYLMVGEPKIGWLVQDQKCATTNDININYFIQYGGSENIDGIKNFLSCVNEQQLPHFNYHIKE